MGRLSLDEAPLSAQSVQILSRRPLICFWQAGNRFHYFYKRFESDLYRFCLKFLGVGAFNFYAIHSFINSVHGQVMQSRLTTLELLKRPSRPSLIH